MPSKDPKKCCHTDALQAIKDAHIRAGRNFRHSCNVGQGQLATPTPGARLNQYNKMDGITPATILLDENKTYPVCKNMKKKIDDAFKKRDRAAVATNNNTAASNPGNAAIRDPPVKLLPASTNY